MTAGKIDYEKRGHIAVVTINRPDRHNATTPDMMAAIDQLMADAEADHDVWAIVLTGAGRKSFCVGGDLEANIPRLTGDPDKNLRTVVPDPTKRFFSDIYTPVICAVNGFAIAGGMEMLLGTDIRIAGSHATFGVAEVRWAIVPIGGSNVRLPRQVPWAVAMESLLTGDNITAERAYEIGLINKVVEPGSELDAAMALAERLCQNGPLALRAIKESAVRSLALESAFSQDYYISSRVFHTEDAKEGPRSFMEKRDPEFHGR
jgi:enoyl-CoA hydratase